MAWRREEPQPGTAREEYGRLTIEHLLPLARLLVADPPKRKGELVDVVLYLRINPLGAWVLGLAADCRLFFSTDAGGVGLNLQFASAVVNVDLPWNPEIGRASCRERV